MSEHADIREILEIAAVEPNGLDRLEAGDTPEAIAVAGHLTACPDCLEELARLRRAEALLRPAVASLPDPALRERTLAFVRAVGVTRGPAAVGVARGPAAAREQPPAATLPTVSPDATSRWLRRLPAPAWLGAIAAALVIGLVGGSLLTGAGRPSSGDGVTAMSKVTRETAALLAAGDARQVVLKDAAGTAAGTLVLSSSAGRMVVTATGLATPAAGAEYRCWVEIGGARSALGTMIMAGDVGWWSGAVSVPAKLPAGIVYGVSLVKGGSSGPGTVVLTGEL